METVLGNLAAAPSDSFPSSAEEMANQTVIAPPPKAAPYGLPGPVPASRGPQQVAIDTQHCGYVYAYLQTILLWTGIASVETCECGGDE